MRDFLEFRGVRIIAQAHVQAQGLEIIAQNVFFLGRRTFVHAEQARMLALLDEVRAAHVGSQHRLFNQAVRFVAHTRHDFLNASIFIANNLGFCGFKVHRPPHRP